MTIKELTYLIQQHLQVSTGLAFKRTHIYELLAALFDFNSYAALCCEAVFTQKKQHTFTQWQQDEKQSSQHNIDIKKRCLELGYSSEIADAVSSHLLAFINEHQLDVVRLSDLVDKLRNDPPFSSEHIEWHDNLPPILLDELENAASKNNMLAHYALALINFTDNEEDVNDYWFTQEQSGRFLTGVEKEWADTYKKFLAKLKKCSFHLREAGRLGSKEALLDLADRFDDPAFFETFNDTVDEEPLRIAEIAERLGREEDMKSWLIIAAEEGDTEAIIQLIEELKHDDLQQCWTWVYLAKMLGTDLTRSDLYAIHEDGSLYDDDVGGTMFVAGRDELNLIPLNDKQDAESRQAAKELFKRI